jgi:hypothetical protein
MNVGTGWKPDLQFNRTELSPAIIALEKPTGIVDPHQLNRYTSSRKKSTSANVIASCTIIETVLYGE